MAEAATKLPIKTEGKASAPATSLQSWRPFEALRHEVDRLFDSFDRDASRSSFHRSFFDAAPILGRELAGSGAPAVDIAEKPNAYEVTAELPGLDEKNVEVTLVNGALTIKGEKHEEKEEKRKDYYLKERRFGSFERRFAVPEGVDAEKIEASFKNGVLTVTLPKTPEAQKPEKKIEVKSA